MSSYSNNSNAATRDLIRGAGAVDSRVNMLVSINPNDHAVVGLRPNGRGFRWYHFTATGIPQEHTIGDRRYSAQPAEFTSANEFELGRASGSFFGFNLPRANLLRLQAFISRRHGMTSHLRNDHELAWRDPLYARFNCATAVGYCLEAAGIVPPGNRAVESGAMLRFILRNRMFSNPHWMVWRHEV